MKITVTLDAEEYDLMPNVIDVPLSGALVEVCQRETLLSHHRDVVMIETVPARATAMTTGESTATPAIRLWLRPEKEE